MMPLCPACRNQCVQRVHGTWCSRCRGWYRTATKWTTGRKFAYIQTYRYLP